MISINKLESICKSNISHTRKFEDKKKNHSIKSRKTQWAKAFCCVSLAIVDS